MANEFTLSAVPRAHAGRVHGGEAASGSLASARTARQVRRVGYVPAILYGHGLASTPLAIDAREFGRLLPSLSSSTLVTLHIGESEPRRVLIHELQLDPLTGKPTHIDFHQVRLTEKIHAKVPLKAVNVSSAVKDLGGVLVQSLAEIDVESYPQDLPSDIPVDLSRLATFDDRITVADLAISANVVVHAASTDVVAVVTPPRSEEELKQLETPTETPSVAEVKTEAEEKKAAETTQKAAEEKEEK